jgi:lipoprotein-releasing system permease protein
MIEKKNDIKLLFHLGASPRLVQRIFFFEGILTTAVGAISG